MIRTQKQLQREIHKKMNSLTDEEIFLSEAYANLLSSMDKGIIKSDKGGKTYIEKMNNLHLAYTDGESTHINLIHPFIKERKTPEEKHKYILGTKLHEDGHRLFTDFKLNVETLEKLSKKNLYPFPIGNPYLTETLEAFELVDMSVISNIYHKLDNTIEDGFVNHAVCALVPGYGESLKYSYTVTADQEYASYDTLKEKDGFPPSILCKMIYLYCVHGRYTFDINEETEDELKLAFLDLKPFLTKAVYEARPLQRKQLINSVFCYLFHFIMEQLQKKEDSKSNEEDPSPEKKDSPSEKGEKSEEKKKEKSEEEKETLEKALETVSSEMPETEFSCHEGSSTANSEAIEKVENVFSSSSEETAMNEPEGKTPETNSEIAKQLNKAAEEVAKKKISEEQEKELKKENLRIVASVRNQKIHADIIAKIYRTNPSDYAKETYRALHTELDLIVKRLISEFMKQLKDMALGDTCIGLFSGKRLDIHHLYREDKRIFSKKILPVDDATMAVGMLIDGSGSMRNERIGAAIKTAYITYQFCKSLNIPVFVVGHNASGDTVSLYCVADENNLDDEDKYRIFDLSANNSNRDGYALRFCLDKLKKIDADDKLMIVLSDGRPAHRGYGMEEGRADCQDAVHSALKEGIHTIAAGIGSDVDSIKYVYQHGRAKNDRAEFLDISDLSKMPKAFIKIIKQRLLDHTA